VNDLLNKQSAERFNQSKSVYTPNEMRATRREDGKSRNNAHDGEEKVEKKTGKKVEKKRAKKTKSSVDEPPKKVRRTPEEKARDEKQKADERDVKRKHREEEKEREMREKDKRRGDRKKQVDENKEKRTRPFVFHIRRQDDGNHVVIVKVHRPTFRLVHRPKHCSICDTLKQQLERDVVAGNIARLDLVVWTEEHERRRKHEIDDDDDDRHPDDWGHHVLIYLPEPSPRSKRWEGSEVGVVDDDSRDEIVDIGLTKLNRRVRKESGHPPTDSERKAATKTAYKAEFHPQYATVLLRRQQQWVNDWAGVDWNDFTIGAYDLYWKMGMGKTWVTLALLAKHPPEIVYIVCSVTLIGNWTETLRFVPQQRGVTVYHVLGYQEFAALVHENPDLLKSVNARGTRSATTVVVIDEVHYYRNEQRNMDGPLDAICSANAAILLSGTPLVDHFEEASYLVRIGLAMNCRGWRKEDIPAIDTYPDNHPRFAGLYRPTPEQLHMLWKGRVDYFDAKLDDPVYFKKNFPNVEYITRKIPMAWSQVAEYYWMSNKHINIHEAYGTPIQIEHHCANNFDCQTRRISNGCGPGRQPKIDAVAAEVLAFPFYPQAIYSHFLDLGSTAIMAELKQRSPKIKAALLTGKTPAKDRQELVRSFCKGTLEALLFSEAARDGIDLKGGMQVIITEPLDNIPLMEQALARIIRLGGYKDPENTFVRVIYMMSTFPKTKPNSKDDLEIRKFFENALNGGSVRHKFDLSRTDLARFLHDYTMLEGDCVDERLQKRNEIKLEGLLPYYKAMQTAGMSPVVKRH